ncbi:MAG: hypothetical protein FJW32_15370 [Acidobacteria bacterium]|nr:hypothetical protein [Acidobacteriota bacterium]
MARIPAIPEETALTASNVESPELLVALGRAADRAFENDIVPKELFDPFREPTLYVANRVELTPSVPATGSTSVEGDEPPIVTAPPANSRKYLYERQFDSLFCQAVVERYQLKSVTRQLAAAYKESLRLEMGNPKLEKQTTAAQSDRDRLSQREAELNKLAATQGLAPLYGEA